MTKRKYQVEPEGFAQPEIRPGDKWRGKYGELVTVTDRQFNRVIFLRDGYEYPCATPESRFLREYIRIETQSITHWRAVSNPLEKAQQLRELLNIRREKKQ